MASKRRAENFPVALRALPLSLRTDLIAIYNVVRTIDDLGDEASGDRRGQLDEFGKDLDTLFSGGRPRAVVLADLAATVTARSLSKEPFDLLIQANLRDQEVSRYETFADVLSYCALSAVPIGRLVLEVFDQSSVERRELSDRACSALQLLEHWQDIAEDRRAGRIYLPAEDMRRFGVVASDLDQATETPALRRLIAFETARSLQLLESSKGLVAQLSGWARLAVAAYLAGGYATIDALRRSGGRVLAGAPKPRRRDLLRHLIVLLLRARSNGAAR